MPSDSPKGATATALKSIGRYDIQQKIADGGMGSVYRARSQITGEQVAIKIVPPTMANNQVLLKRFEQEFRAASSLDHENIVRALDFGYENSTPYLVMEFVDGETLGQRIDRQGRLPEKEAIKIIAQIAQGLHKAHSQGLVHRDVKPDNILITPDHKAKLADMGLVKEAETELNLTRTGRGLGTPQFMAPEQFRNAKNADARCDIYSLGATLYMALTGDLPFRSCSPLDAWMKKVQNDFPPPKQLVAGISDRVDWAIRRAMSADPQQRPSSCREFVEDLMGRSTKKLATPALANAQAENVWYIVYQDEFGTTHTVKGSTQAIRRCLKEGRLGDAENVRIARSQAGPFDGLKAQPEFRDLIIAPATLPVTPSTDSVKMSTPKSGTPALKPLPPTVRTVPVAAEPSYQRSNLEIQTEGRGRRKVDWMLLILIFLLLACGFAAGMIILLLQGTWGS